MGKIMMVAAAVFVLAGCRLFQSVGVGAPVENVPVSVAEGYTLEKAVVAAANNRHWAPVKTDSGAYRLTIRQRGNFCAVEVRLHGDTGFSIIPVASNITVRKYDQWVDNLRREILHRAMRGK